MIKQVVLIVLLVAILTNQGCIGYGINKNTSEIGSLNHDCISKKDWDIIYEKHGISSIEDSVFLLEITTFEKKPFQTDLIYFSSEPKELIGVADDKYSVRYVYNPNISSKVLDGMSKELDDTEKNRIINRVQELLMEYQCPEGKALSLKRIKEQGGESY